MYNKKYYIGVLCLIFLMMITFVSADKIVNPVTSTEGYIIESNIVDYLATGVDHEFEVHVFNQTNGYPITSGIECYLHLYYDGFGHIYTGSQDTVSNQFDYEFDVAGSNFTQRGEYVAKIQCNSSNYGGAEETFFIVNNYGQELTPELSNNFNWSMMFLMILFLLAIGGLVFMDHYIGKFACYWIAHVLFIVGTFSVWQFNQGYAISFMAFAGVFKVMFYVSTFAVVPMVILSMAWIFYIHLFNEHFQKLVDKGEDPETAFSMAKKKSGGWASGK